MLTNVERAWAWPALLVLDFNSVGDGLLRQIEEVAGSARIESGPFKAHYLEGSRAYTEVLGGNPEALARVVGSLEERVQPLYREWQQRLGLPGEATAGLTARIEELKALQRQAENPVPKGRTKGGVSQVTAAQTLSGRFRRVTAANPRRTLVRRAQGLIGDFIDGANLDPGQARDRWSRGP